MLILWFGAAESGISAAACFPVRPSNLWIDFPVRNGRFHAASLVVGGSLLVAAIAGFAKQLEREALRLECVEDPLTRACYERQGFLA